MGVGRSACGDTVICSVSSEQVEVWSVEKKNENWYNPDRIDVSERERHVDRWTCEERSQCRWMSLNTWGQSSIQCTRGGEEERAGRAAWVETRIRNESIRGTSQSQRGWGVQRRERTYTGYTQEEKRTTSEDISGCSEGGLEWQRRSRRS